MKGKFKLYMTKLIILDDIGHYLIEKTIKEMIWNRFTSIATLLLWYAYMKLSINEWPIKSQLAKEIFFQHFTEY